MPSDRTRNSHDPQRMYRSVVFQQGRVTLDADANEAEQIRADATSQALVDAVGPSGSSDDGFRIGVPGRGVDGFDFLIGAGSMYVGGNRITSGPLAGSYERQKETEWLDHPAGSLAPDPTSTGAFDEAVFLTVTEHEVSAVEDEALREVALGGPDTAARTRLVQRVQRVGVTRGGDCSAALGHLERLFRARGLAFHPESTRLESTGRLRVEFEPPPAAADECAPEADAGFLGPENQLIRVQVDADGDLLWGYDNASFLYRVTIANAGTVELDGIPVDEHHQPQPGQWVEVLDMAIELGPGAQVAAATGQAREVEAYDPTTRVLTLRSGLVAPLAPLAPDEPRQAFVRVWQNKQPRPAAPSQPLHLTDHDGSGIGLLVRVSGHPAVGDFWMIGVRPRVPQQIFPERLLRFQRPDGPRRWMAPLAVVAWNDDLRTATVTDCRPRFENLVDLTERGGGCELLVRPGDALQERIDRAIDRIGAGGANGLHLRFSAGSFELDEPLIVDASRLGSTGGRQPSLTISGCGFGTILEAEGQEVALYARGWDRVGVFDLAARSTAAEPGNNRRPPKGEVFPPRRGDEHRHLGGTISLLHCRVAVVERVALECGDGDRRAASCLTVRSLPGRGSEVRVAASHFAVGSGQVGALVVNAERVTVVDNHIDHRHPIPDERDRWRDPQVLAHLIDQIELEGDHLRGVADGKVDLHIPFGTGARLRLVTDTGMERLWRAALARLDERRNPRNPFPTRPVRPTEAQKQAARRLIARIVAQVTQPGTDGPLTAQQVDDFRAELDEFIVRMATAGGQGIVVAGAVAGDVRIADNTIDNVMTGIRVGLSVRGAAPPAAATLDPEVRAPAKVADRVQIVGNTVSPRVPARLRGAHSGIFVGNVDHATIRDNRVTIDGRTGARRAEGIRVWGVLGPYLLVADNSVSSADTGIRVRPIGQPPKRRIWRVSGNLVLDAADEFAMPLSVARVANVP